MVWTPSFWILIISENRVKQIKEWKDTSTAMDSPLRKFEHVDE